ncbi:MAG: N-methyl-L-tryptophan oxidase [Anaerolineae bacterium]
MYDAIVLGGGVMGAATAYELVKMGQQVLLLERFEPGHTNGSSHGDGRIVRFNYTEPVYVQMAKLAYGAWHDLEQEAGRQLVQKTGLIEYGPVGSAAVQQSRALLAEYDIPFETLTAESSRERFPQYAFQSESELLFQADGAVAFATPAVKSLWELFQERGGTARTGTHIVNLAITPDQVTLTDETGTTYEGRRLVVAAGGWSQQVLAKVGVDLPLTVTQELLAYFPSKDESINHRVGVMPVLIEYFGLDRHFYVLPQVEIPGVKVGWHHSGPVIQPDDERPETPYIVETIQNWVGEIFPGLSTTPIKTQTCLYTNTPDYHFVVDHHPEWSHVMIAAGFSGHGFKFGPIMGRFVARMLMGESVPVDMSTFQIARFSSSAALDKRIGA